MKQLGRRKTFGALILAAALSLHCLANGDVETDSPQSENPFWWLDHLRRAHRFSPVPNVLVTRTWTSAGGSDNWSDSGNWQGGSIPTSGDEVLFGTAGGGGNSIVNYSLTLDAFRFEAAVLPLYTIHIGAALTLNGSGIVNSSNFMPGGTIRQEFYVDASGILTFQNNATVTGNLPVDLSVLAGGRMVFEANSTASGPPGYTFTGLRNYGAAAAGGIGGEIRFQDNSSMGLTSGMANLAGAVTGAAGGTVIFEDNASASGNISNQNGGGLGGRIIFRDHATTLSNIGLDNFGAATLQAGAEAVTQFLDDSVLFGTVLNFGGVDAGMAGGRLEFHNRARFDGTGLDPDLGSFVIINRGALNSAAEGGRTVFYDDSRIVGANIFILNGTENEDPVPGSFGGVTEFFNRSRAGQATINNTGASSGAAGTLAGRTFFRDNSDAESAIINSLGGTLENGAPGGSVEFSGSSNASNATLNAYSGTDGGNGGQILFKEMASGGNARVLVEVGALLDISGLTSNGTSVGSIEGAGNFFLGSKNLVTGGNNLSTVVSGVISDGGIVAETGGSLTKTGVGFLTLSGGNTYTGATAVNGGTLLVNGSLANGAVSVANAATLGGNGIIGGAVTVANGGTISPGSSGPGTLRLGALTLNNSSNLNFELHIAGTIGSGVNDLLVINGSLTLDGILNIAAPAGLTLGVYRLINYTGSFIDNGLTIGTLPAGTSLGDFTLQTSTPGQVNLVLGGAASVLFWDGLQVAPNNNVDGGSGTWNNATTNWTDSAGSVQRGWNGNTAVFSGATAGPITVTDNVNVRGMQFATTGYVVNASPGFNITLDGVVSLRTDTSVGARINAPLIGSGSLNKMGDGTLTLTGDNAYTGGTTVTDGVIVVRNAAGLGLGTGPVTVLESATTRLIFAGNSSAGSVMITNAGSGPGFGAGLVNFDDTSTAATATITNQGNSADGGIGGSLVFDATSRGGSATINNLGAGFSSAAAPFSTSSGGQTVFRGTAAENATITNFAGLGNGLLGGATIFSAGVIMPTQGSAGNATITNRGGTVAGALGGTTQFFGSSNAGSATLIAEGGSNGGHSGLIQFSNTTSGGSARVILNAGEIDDGTLDISSLSIAGMIIGSIEGSGRVSLGSRQLSVGSNNLSTTFSGLIADGGIVSQSGGSLNKVGTGSLTLTGSNTYTGGTTVADGVLIVTNPSGQGLGTGAVTVFATPTSALTFSGTGSAGLSISNLGSSSSSFSGGTTFIDQSTAGSAFITNHSSTANNGSGGFTQFGGTSTAANATIFNLGSFFTGGSIGAEVFFFATSTAGSAIINNGGGLVANGEGGQANFFNSASAGSATITNFAANAANAFEGATVFRSTSSAGSAIIRNAGSSIAGGSGGVIEFYESTTAGTATISIEGGTVSGALASVTRFFGNSSADHAAISVQSSVSSTGAGVLEFQNSASAGAATITNQRAGSASGFGGQTIFHGTSQAGSSLITNEGTLGGFGGGGLALTTFRDTSNAQNATFLNRASEGTFFGGLTLFFDSSRAGSAIFDNEGSKVTDGFEGDVQFFGSSSADAATITNHGKTVSVASAGGIAYFNGDSKAGTAKITNEGSSFATTSGFAGGSAQFSDGASAEQATIINLAPLTSSGGSGVTSFNGNVAGKLVTADRATITNAGGLSAVRYGGQTFFQGTASAGAANITNGAGRMNLAFGGITTFGNTATAGAANFLNEGATIAAYGGTTRFFGTSTAGTATFHNAGSVTASGGSGGTEFYDSSTAGQATLYADVGGEEFAPGGGIIFFNTSEGGTARAIVAGTNGGSTSGGLDISQLTDAGMSIGSIEGGGIVSLGRRNLAVGTNNLSTEFSGLIRDGGFVNQTGGSLNKVGAGTLTLSGTNTYTGLTTVAAGKLRINGFIPGNARVNSGAILGGTGRIGGAVTVDPGGIFAPGSSPGTITVGALSLDNDSILEFELGLTSDLIVVNGDLLLDGILNIFDSGGLVGGQSYALFSFTGTLTDNGLQIGSVPAGFIASDFTFTQTAPGQLGLAVVPEPSALWLILFGFVLLTKRYLVPRLLVRGIVP